MAKKGRTWKATPALKAALAVRKAVKDTGTLPAPRVEVQKIGKGYRYRHIDKAGKKGKLSQSFTLLNNCRRALLHLDLGLPIVSL